LNFKKEELYECTGHLEEQKTTKSVYQLIWFFSREVSVVYRGEKRIRLGCTIF